VQEIQQSTVRKKRWQICGAALSSLFVLLLGDAVNNNRGSCKFFHQWQFTAFFSADRVFTFVCCLCFSLKTNWAKIGEVGSIKISSGSIIESSRWSFLTYSLRLWTVLSNCCTNIFYLCLLLMSLKALSHYKGFKRISEWFYLNKVQTALPRLSMSGWNGHRPIRLQNNQRLSGCA